MILVDTSIWIDYLGPKPGTAAGRLDQLIEQGEAFALTPVILQEILQGTRSEKEFTKLQRNLLTQHILFPLDSIESHIAAADIYAKCRRKGVTPRSSIDCLIAQVAIEHGVPLLHNDGDYERIAGVIPELIIYE
ncbi:MAG TPA: PIN domain-containing protein [Tepidisphaeraceae bacterium]|nr:PIN domain-containing protein [Tepidisphaeraceae bacterium]